MKEIYLAGGIKIKFSLESQIGNILSVEKGRMVLNKYVPGLRDDPSYECYYRLFSLSTMVEQGIYGLKRETAEKIVYEMNSPIEEAFPRILHENSLDELDRRSFGAKPPPLSHIDAAIEVKQGGVTHPGKVENLTLDGVWEMAAGGDESARFGGSWDDAIAARVPGSIHTALYEAGKIPDPTFGTNQRIAKKESSRTWWLKRTFSVLRGKAFKKLVFGGVANKCTVWLNGILLGNHEGMFGGPEFDVEGILKGENLLIVRLDPIPSIDGSSDAKNRSWESTIVINNVYGWHYSNLPSLGIWRPVIVTGASQMSIINPFVAAINAGQGIVGLHMKLQGGDGGWKGLLRASFTPFNFEGGSCHFEKWIDSDEMQKEICLRLQIPDHHLWWPVDIGAPDLYTVQLSFTPENGSDAAYTSFLAGIRTVEMQPFPEGPAPDKYNWTFVINGKPSFIKGTGWCTMDVLLDFSAARYERFIALAKQQHVQMLRAWGSGMPETDEFYDACDRHGIMVIQEWPTAWNSHMTQPYNILEETVRMNTLRIRNHPSLVMWGAGNESWIPSGSAIDMMGRLSVELDGTRPFHRGEPMGGSLHNYDCWWGRRHPDLNLGLTAGFIGEFGLASVPSYESVLRYLPEEEKDIWPPDANGAFAYHTPVFNTAEDLSRLFQYSGYFTEAGCGMKDFITGSQLAQATAVRHTLELARIRWPYCTGALYYKLNDNFPAASWASVDWYGAPKIGHYIFQDAFAPLHACVVFTRLNFLGTPQKLPVWLMDDAGELENSDWKVSIRAYDGKLQELKREVFEGRGVVDSPLMLGELDLSYEESLNSPLFIVTDVIKDGRKADRTFYWTNYEAEKGSLFRLSETSLQ